MKKAIYCRQGGGIPCLIYKGNAAIIETKWKELRNRWRFDAQPAKTQLEHDDAFFLERCGKGELWLLQTCSDGME